METKETHERLRDALLEFVAGSSSHALDPFRDAMASWGDKWVPVRPVHLPVSDFLTPALCGTNAQTHALTAMFEQARTQLKWEQSYTKADGVVGDDMLRGYGFAEIIGKLGPFVSTRVRSGIGLWGPNVNYPMHYHAAEEIYVLLSGSANFKFDDGPVETRSAGDSVYVPSMTKHGFCSLDAPLAVFYIWQAGDLRETSKFD